MKLMLRLMGSLLLLCFGFGLGVWFTLAHSAEAQEDDAFPLLDEAVSFVEANFVKPQPDSKAVEYALIRAYLGQLGDANTFFIEPAVAASESDVLAGRYGGIGVDVQRNEAGEAILYPFPESSALAAGIRDGDVLLAINGEPLVLEMTMDEIRQSLRGEIKDNAGVTLRVRNLAETEEREYFVPFAEVLVPSTTWRVLYEAPDFGYIKIERFTSRTPEEFASALEDLRAAGIKSLILDLRSNPGGLFQESLVMTDEFLDGGVLSIEQRIGGETYKDGQEGGAITDLPLVVLVNHGTASAAEIMAAAIQARGRGVLIGEPTYGKGSIQSIFALSDGSSIHVTTALWYTPDRQPLDAVGVTPDVVVVMEPTGRDIVLGEAIRYLQGEEE